MIPFLLAVGERKDCLHPLTMSMATPLFPIANRPVVVHVVELLARFGYREILVGLHDTADQIEQTLGNGQRWNVQFTYLAQQQPAGLGELLQRVATELTDTCLILPADMLVDFDIDTALAFHRAHGGGATALLCPAELVPTSTPRFAINAQEELVVAPTAHSARYIDTQIYLLEPDILSRFHLAESSAHEHSLITTLQKHNVPVHGHVLTGYWNPLTSFAEIQTAQAAALTGIAQSVDGALVSTAEQSFPLTYAEGKQVAPGVWCGQGATIYPNVSLTPPVYIGPYSHIGRNVELGPNTVIGANCLIDDGATVRQSTVLANSYVGQLTSVEGKIVQQGLLIDIETNEHVQITDQFLLGEVEVGAVNTAMWNRSAGLFTAIGAGIRKPFQLFTNLMKWIQKEDTYAHEF